MGCCGRPNEAMAHPERATLTAAKSLGSLSAAERRALRKAVVALSQVALVLRLSTFQRLANGLDHYPEMPPLPDLDEDQWAQVETTAWAIRAAGRRLPVPNSCLAQAFAAQRLCPDIPGAIILGVTKDSTDRRASLAAHAWWRCGDRILLGNEGRQRFTPISALTWGFEPDA